MDFKKAFRLKIEKILLPESRLEEAGNLYPGQGIGEVRKHLSRGLRKRLLYTLLIGAVLMLTLIVKGVAGKGEGLDFTRNSLNEGNSSTGLILSFGDREMEYDLIVGSIELGDEKIDALQQLLEEGLDKYILGDNPDFLHVSKDLRLPLETELEGYKLKLSWSSDHVDIVDTKGAVNTDSVDKNATVTIRAKVRYGKEFRIYERLLTIVPTELTEAEKKLNSAISQIEKIESDRGKSDFSLPEVIDGVSVSLSDKGKNYIGIGLFLALLMPVIGYFSYFEGISEKRKQRVQKGMADYKDFIRKLTLLLSAGMSVRLAWKKLCMDSSKGQEDSLLSQALQVSLRELDSGIREGICYQRFGERMGSRSYERLAEILSQQSQKGVSHVAQVLEAELKDVCDSEKEQIRVKAEKAGTVLLLPIVGLLTIVFLVIMVPAFAGMSV